MPAGRGLVAEETIQPTTDPAPPRERGSRRSPKHMTTAVPGGTADAGDPVDAASMAAGLRPACRESTTRHYRYDTCGNKNPETPKCTHVYDTHAQRTKSFLRHFLPSPVAHTGRRPPTASTLGHTCPTPPLTPHAVLPCPVSVLSYNPSDWLPSTLGQGPKHASLVAGTARPMSTPSCTPPISDHPH
jgi:hypothetical protein